MFKLKETDYGVVAAIVSFIGMAILSIVFLYDFAKLYDDKQYADMITCSENINLQIYEKMMHSFSRVLSASDMVSYTDDLDSIPEKQLQRIIQDSDISCVLFAPDGVITNMYPYNKEDTLLGLDLSSDFPEPIKTEDLKGLAFPTIIGPFDIPGTSRKSMGTVISLNKKNTEEEEYWGSILILVDYPEFLTTLDFSILNEKNILCKIWMYNEYSKKIQTFYETEEPLPLINVKNNSTFTKMFFTTPVNFSMASKIPFYKSIAFVIIMVFMFVATFVVPSAIFYVINGIRDGQKLKYYEVQEELLKVQEHTINSLSSLVENRDSDTGEHILRTSNYVYLIAKEAQKVGLYSDILTNEYIDMLKDAAPMHDIGKIVVPDAVLKKPGKLTTEEFEQIKLHTTMGSHIVQDILGPVRKPDFVKTACEISLSHHEKWNGEGYPYGLSGFSIPLSARIMALADVFDALTSPRCYKEPFPFEKAIEIIESASGTQFDPRLTAVFLANQPKLKEIMKHFKVLQK